MKDRVKELEEFARYVIKTTNDYRLFSAAKKVLEDDRDKSKKLPTNKA
jgi:hypothetical protein